MGRPKKYKTDEERKAARREYNKKWKEKNSDYFKNKKEQNAEYFKKWKEKNSDYFKNWKEQNAERIKEYSKQYYKDHVEHKREYFKQYYQNNAEHIKEYSKQYYQDNAEHFKQYRKYNAERSKQYYQDNADSKREYSKQYYRDHEEYYKQYYKQYRKDTTIGRANSLIASYRENDKKYNRGECTLTAKWVVENILSKSCHYCGESNWKRLGCDRIDNTKPHTQDNVVPCCGSCNRKRGKKDYNMFVNEIEYKGYNQM